MKKRREHLREERDRRMKGERKEERKRGREGEGKVKR